MREKAISQRKSFTNEASFVSEEKKETKGPLYLKFAKMS